MIDQDLETLEQRTFLTVTDDGLWDVLIAAVFTNLAIGPLPSEDLGDFWSSALLAPVWLAMYLVIRVMRRRIVNPRVGTVRFGTDRRKRLRKLSIVMLIVNVLAALLRAVAAIGVQTNWLDLGDGRIGYPPGLGIVVLVGFSGAAFMTGIARYFSYGLMLSVGPLIGEWLWRNDLATHHGYPIVFGTAAAIVLVTGIARFMAVLRRHPLPQHPATV